MKKNDNYQPYGEEWEKEMMKLPKKIIIDMVRAANKEKALEKYKKEYFMAELERTKTQ